VQNRRMRAATAVVAAFALALTGCSVLGGGTPDGPSVTPGDNKGALIGVAMPTKTSERWIDDGNNVKKELEALGYRVDLQYASDKVPAQQQQLESMLDNGAKALIIAAIDGTALTGQLADAGERGVKVISYDRLINESPDVDYYVTFDNNKVGVQQGTSLLTGLGIKDKNGKDTGEKGPFNIELFAGSPDDNNAEFFFNGAMSVLKPYLESGVLRVPSKQTAFPQVAIQQWTMETAQARMDTILVNLYGSRKLDGVLSPNDTLARGILNATKARRIEYPVVTGQDAEKPSDKLILEGVQYSTVFKDTRKLGKTAAVMVDDVLNGRDPEVNDTTTYNNQVKVVPSYLHASVIITKENLIKEIVDSGYYTREEVEKGG
jgi:putative multiple sugar transport system substrate-binding protein